MGQFVEQPPRYLQHPHRMGKAGSLCPVEGKKGRVQLADAAQPLKGRCIDQANEQSLNRVPSIQANGAMQGIVVGAGLAKP
jgi:hypothetical protein